MSNPAGLLLHFHSTSFLQGTAVRTLLIFMIIHSSLHAPACSHRTATHQYTVHFSSWKSTQKFLSWTQQHPLLLWWMHCCCRPWCRAASHGTAEPSTSCQVPEELHAASPQSHHGPQERTESQPWDKPAGLDSFGIQDTPSPHQGENWTGPGSFGCTHNETFILSGFCCLCCLRSSQKLPHSTLFLLAAPFVSYPLTFTCGSPEVSPISFRVWFRPMEQLQYKHSCICNLQGI